MQSRLALLFILVTVGIDATGIGIIFPVMPQLMTEVTGSDIAHAALWGGALATSYSAMQFLFGPVVGNLSDRYGRRPVLLISLAVMVVDYLIMALAPSIWVLLVGRVVAGIAGATYATANAYLADVTEPEHRAKAFGYMGAAFGVGFILGPLLGGILAGFGTRAPFYAAAAIAGANLILGLLVVPESLNAELRRPFSLGRSNPLASFAAIGHLPGLRRYLAVWFTYTIAFTSYPAVWAFFGTERFGWDGWWNGMSLALFGICMVAVQGAAVAPAIALLGAKRTASYGMGLEVVTFGFYALVTSGTLALIFTPIASIAGVAGPALQGLTTNATPDDQQGELQGVLASVGAVASGLAPMLMTGVFYFFTKPGAPVYFPGAPFVLAAALMAISVLILIRDPGPAIS